MSRGRRSRASERSQHERPRGSHPGPEPIAIVGIGCRYADARGPGEFWEIVRQRRNTVRDVPHHRVLLGYDIDHFFDPRPRIPGRIASKKGGFLEHPELFDPEAFGIAPRDALTMEPQQRLMIEVTWDALDDAGIPVESVAGERVAVILGYMAEDYSRERAGVLGEAAVYRGHDVFTVGGMSHAVLSGRISFLLGVTGPSLTLDTACSSSLYATHLACESLRRGESALAIAGGVNLFLSPEGNIALSRSGMLSLSGACKAFDASADGFVRAEGAGVVVLRPLSDALAAGNPIYAVIRGSGISADGRDGGHMMAPGRRGQAQAMRDAYAMAGVSPADVHYVETHGTGTMIGDPVEIGALADVMGPGRPAERKLRVASIKGNLGHSESASGIAGLINAALSIRHRTLPPQLHFETPNPAIPWAQVPIEVQRELEPWPFPEPPLVGVNSFGISGTNAHFILEAPPEREAPVPVPLEAPVLLLLSAHDPNALLASAEALRDWLVGHPELDLRDLAYTLARRRSLRAHRLALVAASLDEARSVLDAYLAGEASPALRSGFASAAGAAPLVMVFPGQGSQWLGMGRQLLRREYVFAEAIDRLDAAYRAHVDWSLRAVLEGRGADAGGLDVDWTMRLDVLQPVLVAVEIALATLWRHFGVEPARVLGQSMGELAAAHVAGALGLEDLARVACERGRVVARVAGRGAMAVVSLGRERVEARLADGLDEGLGDGLDAAFAGGPADGIGLGVGGRVEVAGSNSPRTTILSGDAAAVEAAVVRFETEGLFARRLEVDFASHCFHMDPLLEPFRAAIGEVAARPAAIPFDSTVDGRTRAGETLDADYWLRNLREAVAFDRGLATSLEAGGELFLEVSPHPSLPRAIDETAESLGRAPRYLASLRRDEDESRSLLLSLAELFVRGQPIDRAALFPVGRVVSLPLYAYQRRRFFFSERTRLDLFRPVHPLLGARSDSSLDPRLHSWDFLLDADSGSFVEDVRDPQGPPGTTIRRASDGLAVELALAAGDALWPGRATRIEELVPLRPFVLGAEGRRRVQVVLRETGCGAGELRIASRGMRDAEWCVHATARLAVPAEAAAEARPEPRAVAAAPGAVPTVDALHAAFERCGVAVSSKGRILRELEAEPADGGGGVVAKLMLPRTIESEWYAYHAHPLLLEAATQLAGALLEEPAAVRLRGIESVELAGGLGSDCRCVARRRPLEDPRRCVVDLEFRDRQGARLGVIGGLVVEPLTPRVGVGESVTSDWHRIDWVGLDPAHREAPREVDRFILVSDSEANAAWLAAELEKQGVVVRFCEKVEDLEPLVQLHRATGDGRYGFLLLAWSDRGRDEAPEPAFQRAFRVGQWAAAIRAHTFDAAQIWIATRGLQARTAAPTRAGLGRDVAREIDAFASCAEMQACRLFDARAELGEIDLVWLATLVGRAAEERQFVMAELGPRVPRLVAVAEPGSETAVRAPSTAGSRSFTARASGREGRAALALQACADPAAGPGEIAVEVEAASLSGFDVLTGLGLERAGDAPAGGRGFGLDFAGVVTGVGPGVRDLSVGDRVVGLRPGSLGRRIAVPRGSVARLPARLDGLHATSLAWPSLVASHVLDDVARVRSGDRVLIVSAGGGIGQALVGRAVALGARVFATAGTAARRAAVAAQGATLLEGAGLAGEGAPDEAVPDQARFDVIVGAESGPALHARIATLAEGGRYVDLCPRERFERPELGALRLGANRAYLAVDALAALGVDDGTCGARLARAMADFETGTLAAIPLCVFPIAEADRALRFMSQNRHVGRVVVDFAQARSTPVWPDASGTTRLIEGRRAIVSATPTSEAAARVGRALAARLGAQAAIEAGERADAASRAGEVEVADAIWIHVADEAVAGPDPLRHRLATVVGPERLLVSLREDVVDEPARDRAWEARLWIDRLLLAGANAAVAGAGAVEPAGRASGRSVGLSLGRDATPERVVRAVAAVLAAGGASAVAGRDQLVWMPAAERALRTERAPSPILAALAAEASGRRAFDRAAFLALSPPERRAALLRHVVEELAGVLGLSTERREGVDPASRLDALGLDSLMTLELFMGLGRSLELPLAADWFPPAPTLAEIAQILVRRLETSLAGAAA
ncbi:MAG: beta-ketoacyl synthase N-terminal-like domain-containing protein [Myxococcota bacterium]